ncbi:MAG TPA: transglutaminase family protein [Xanthobacteraceae bacterium]|nr:transglutaminase family protein [Xanthobacteraceae bacterium]
MTLQPTLHRRDMLRGGAAALAATAWPGAAPARAAFAPAPGAWRSFTMVTRLEIAEPQGRAQAWVPLPSVNEAAWFRSGPSTWTTNAATAERWRDPVYGAELLHVTWADDAAAPMVEVTSRIATRDRAVDLASPAGAPALSAAERAFYLAPSDLIPTDGIVKETADRITARATGEVAKARAVYEWMVENTYRDANVRGCGIGDVAAMLASGKPSGKCADLNALTVALARAAGLPARDLYGVRIAPSRFGYQSLGARSEIVTTAQHCRAEVFLAGFGWVPIDPADVRKVVLEEPPGHLAIGDAKVAAVRAALFGAWEGNWLAYNVAHDLALPGSHGPKVGFLMYPQAETAAGRLDCLDADAFKYTIRSSEVAA